MDADTLTFLLGGGGYPSGPESGSRNPGPRPPIPFADLVRHIVDFLDHHRAFPGPWKNERGPGIIERVSKSKYVWLAYQETEWGKTR